MDIQLNETTLIQIPNATVDFHNIRLDGIETLYFDTSKSAPPHPMVNAMAGLKILKENQQLMMINHHSPDGLFPKIETDFNYQVKELTSGNVQVVFTKKTNEATQTNFDDNQCAGGCA